MRDLETVPTTNLLTCNNCGSTTIQLTLKLTRLGIPPPADWLPKIPWPEYRPQIKATCASCEKYIKFVKATPEIIELFNNELAFVVITGEVADGN